MLTDTQIKQLIKEGKISITPFNESDIKAGKYDIHLGSTLLLPQRLDAVINPKDPTIQPEYKKVDISENSFILKPGAFVLGQTLEVIGLSADVGMFLDGSTTLARLGVTVHLSSSFIPPGQDPHIITLEIFNAGLWQIELSTNLRIGKLLVFTYDSDNEIATRTFNRYNGQQEVTGAKIKEDNKS
jgi:dCTP deaminase